MLDVVASVDVVLFMVESVDATVLDVTAFINIFGIYMYT